MKAVLDEAGVDSAGMEKAQLCETVKKKLEGVVDNVYDDRQRFKKEVRRAIDKDIITNGLTYALATGNWCVDNAGQPAKTGVAQVLDRLSYASNGYDRLRDSGGIGWHRSTQ